MKIVITGGGGFLGQRLARRLLAAGTVVDQSGNAQTIREIVLCDVVAPQSALLDDPRIRVAVGDIADANFTRTLLDVATTSVIHLAAVVSGQAEAEMDVGLRVNLDGTRVLLEACRALGTTPRFVFASSLAVYGGDLPTQVSESTPLTPQSSYGTQKAIGELLVNDYSRKGHIDGRALRLPTIIVRPGKPNRAASTFASSIIREPLQGDTAVCPVQPDVTMAVMSPRLAIAAIEHAHNLLADAYGQNRVLQLPGLSVSVAQMVEALQRAGGDDAVGRIAWRPDPAIERIVAGWPRAIDGRRAEALGIVGDRSIDDIVRFFVEDDRVDPHAGSRR